MKYQFAYLLLVGLFSLGLISCEKDENDIDTRTLSLNISGLSDLGPDHTYEGWMVVDGDYFSTGSFTVDSNGGLSQSQFQVHPEKLENAEAFVLTIESESDPDTEPSTVRLLAGNFSGNEASLSIAHGNAIGTDLTSAKGKYILATPTDGQDNTQENSGVWWLDPTNGPGRGLELPELGTGWKYEGWAVINGIPVSTGKFTSVVDADESDHYSSTTASGPAFPGEDFLLNAPAGLDFPVNLAGRQVVISVEPDPDNHPSPFLLKPLVGNVPDPALDHTSYDMTNNALNSSPTGKAVR